MHKYGEMKKAGDWVGKKVRLKRDLQNKVAKFPKGSICTVNYAYAGLDLTGPKCSKCGVSIFIRKVPYGAVETV